MLWIDQGKIVQDKEQMALMLLRVCWMLRGEMLLRDQVHSCQGKEQLMQAYEKLLLWM
jgi:hypothetical protein